jgi:hypothetical protein
MGNFKNIMHSLRSRFSPSKDKVSPASSSSTATSYASPPPVFDLYGSSSTLRTSPSSITDMSLFTPPTTQSKSPRTAHKNKPVLDSPHEMQDIEEVPSIVQAQATADQSEVSPYAELAASLSMLDFARNLPLEELSMIGRSLEPPLVGCTDTSTDLMDFSGCELVHQRAQIVTPEKTSPTQTISRSKEIEARVVELPSSVTQLQQSSSHTLSLSSESSATTWSFACRSARRIEGEHELPGIDEDQTSSFDSLSGWGVGDVAEPTSSLIQRLEHAAVIMSDAEFNALPDYSDVEDDLAYDEPFIRDADM